MAQDYNSWFLSPSTRKEFAFPAIESFLSSILNQLIQFPIVRWDAQGERGVNLIIFCLPKKEKPHFYEI